MNQEHDSIRLERNLAGAQATIDLAALTENWRYLKSNFKGKICGATVKANAYGVGIKQVVNALHSAGCQTFFVALPQEGEQVRQFASNAEIYVLNGLLPNQSEFYHNFNLIPVLGDLEEIKEWSNFATNRQTQLPYAIHVDTGINRLGLNSIEFKNLLQESAFKSNLCPVLVLTHLACADDSQNKMNSQQLEKFASMRTQIPDVPASMCNSAGIFLGPSYHFEVARPGISIYGAEAVSTAKKFIQAVVTLEARILQVRRVKKGEAIGYGSTRVLERNSRIATLSCGYADGYMRLIGSSKKKSHPYVMCDGFHSPLMGRVSMDQIQIDVTDLPEEICHRGKMVELFGKNISIDDVASWAGTIGHELLVNIGSRLHKTYTS